jgi:DNA gyrase/topoisomerase IV subunit B
MAKQVEWEKLSPYNQVRRRAEMYFGSRDLHTQIVPVYTDKGPALEETTWVPAVYCCVRELIDNALDELVTHRRGKRLEVTYNAADQTYGIADDGGGLPISYSEEHKGYAPTILLSSMFSGRNFVDQRGEARGLNGIGAKGVNYCSEWFQIDIHRDKQQFIQSFAEGDELQIGEPFIWPVNSKRRGTAIRFRLSQRVFPCLQLPETFLRARLREIALCYPSLHVSYNGTPVIGNIRFDRTIEFTMNTDGFNSRFWLVPDFVSDGDYAYSLVNAIPLFNGGVHIDAFRRHFYTGLLDSLDRESRRRRLSPNRADVSDGLLIYTVAEMANPSFDSQAKTRLINEPVGHAIRQSLTEDFFKEIIRKHPAWIETIYDRCAKRSQEKDAREAARKGKRNLRQKVEDLEDACGHDRSKCILFLAEGDSAISGLVKARDPEVHGGLPLLGKVLNVFGESPKRILENQALSKVMTAIGLIAGQPANRWALRYGRIYLTTDADPDGANIMALLCNFFYTCWPELFDPTRPPYIYAFNTPLIIAVKGKQRRYWYADDYRQFDPAKFTGWDITRAKGLAALVKEDWQHVLAHPRAVPLVDDGQLREALSLLFDTSKADLRKQWMGL